MPLCRHCGKHLRQGVPEHPCHTLGTPWNYHWDGKCKSCGCTYNVYVENTIAENQIKISTLVASAHRMPSPYFSPDTFYVLSGVTFGTMIMNGTRDSDWHEVFLSTSELKNILDVISSNSFSCNDFSFRNPIDKDQDRVISIHKDSLWIDAPSSNYDTDDFIWGVTIEESLKRGVEIRDCNKLFLAEYELRYILDALRNSPLLEQIDYYLDMT